MKNSLANPPREKRRETSPISAEKKRLRISVAAAPNLRQIYNTGEAGVYR